MIVSFGLALALALQGAVAADPTLVVGEQTSEVAFGELEDGRTQAAIARLERLRDGGNADAALLINLGVAYERAGRESDALAAYRQAADAEEYELELADGSWRSSRDIATVALQRLDTTAVAVR